MSRIIVGPYASMVLSDMGCEIIKVESPEGDPTRIWGPPWHDNTSSYFLSVNRNKKSIVLDFKKQNSKNVFYKLIESADAVIQNFIPGTVQKLQIDYQTVKKYNESIIYCSVSGYGDIGPLKNTPAFDNTIQAESGFMHLTGEQHPFKVGFAITDVVTALYSVNAILSGIIYKKNTGKGLHLKTSLYECAVASLINQGSNYLNGNCNPQRLGNHHPNIVPYGLYEAKDNKIVICVGTPNQYKHLLNVLKMENKAQFQTNQQRIKHRKKFDQYLNNALKNHQSEYLVKIFRQNSIPCSVVNSIKQTLQSNLAKELNIVHNVENVKYIRNPIRCDIKDSVKTTKPPSLNQHGKDILAQLGYSQEFIHNFFESTLKKG